MPIKAKCGSCGAGFKAKEALAGKKLPCPKCKQPMRVPPKAVAAAAAAPRRPAYNPLLDLLDEAEVKAASQGPVCENCGSELAAHAIMCIDCGFNMSTGQKIETANYAVDDDDDYARSAGLSDAEKIMQKAEREIEDMPVTAVGQNFGDGADSILIAVIAAVIMGFFVLLSLAVIFLMDRLADSVSSPFISMVASMGLWLTCYLWITFVAFKVKSSQGIICACTLGFYCVIFGFMQGKSMFLPATILGGSMFIGLISFIFWRRGGTTAMLWELGIM